MKSLKMKWKNFVNASQLNRIRRFTSSKRREQRGWRICWNRKLDQRSCWLIYSWIRIRCSKINSWRTNATIWFTCTWVNYSRNLWMLLLLQPPRIRANSVIHTNWLRKPSRCWTLSPRRIPLVRSCSSRSLRSSLCRDCGIQLWNCSKKNRLLSLGIWYSLRIFATERRKSRRICSPTFRRSLRIYIVSIFYLFFWNENEFNKLIQYLYLKKRRSF